MGVFIVKCVVEHLIFIRYADDDDMEIDMYHFLFAVKIAQVHRRETSVLFQ